MPAPRATASDLRRIGLAAEQIGVDRSTLYRAAKSGQITLIKCGVMTFVDMAEVANWIAPGEKQQLRGK